ncbi:MAG: hypothetical protein J0H34_23150 [Rhizobiales bacterium]|nr:hypothetical protein [Hyphomicrobiales bacterium]
MIDAPVEAAAKAATAAFRDRRAWFYRRALANHVPGMTFREPEAPIEEQSVRHGRDDRRCDRAGRATRHRSECEQLGIPSLSIDQSLRSDNVRKPQCKPPAA